MQWWHSCCPADDGHWHLLHWQLSYAMAYDSKAPPACTWNEKNRKKSTRLASSSERVRLSKAMLDFLSWGSLSSRRNVPLGWLPK
mmetsp:Transcript_26288/g.73538  ORF Transcript_26288/g.73538 Transcript_26288/m.73538 type:complete len:85 (-) Transcript_26288:197-451(-)